MRLPGSLLQIPAALALLLASACGDDRPPPPPLMDVDGGAATSDGSIAAGDGSTGADGAAPSDGAVGVDADVSSDAGLEVTDPCELADTDEVTLGPAPSGATSPALAGGDDRVVAVWVEQRTGIPQVVAESVTTGGVAGAPVLASVELARHAAPAVTALGARFFVAWQDNSLGRWEIFGRIVDASATPATDAILLSDDDSGDARVAATELASGDALVAWIGADTMEAQIVRTRRVASSGVARGARPTNVSTAMDVPATVALAPFGDGAVLGVGDAENRRVARVSLDSTGAGSGTPLVLDTEANGTGAVGVATVEGSAAFVFPVRVDGTRPEVRFRRLDESLAPLGTERLVTLPPSTGEGAAVAHFRGGWAAAYSTGAADGSRAIEIALMSRDGLLVGLSEIATGAADASPTLAATVDGALYAGWVSARGSSATYVLGRVRCGE